MVECAPLLVCSNPTWIDVIRQNYQRKIVHTYHEPAKPPVYANENCVRLKLQNISVVSVLLVVLFNTNNTEFYPNTKSEFVLPAIFSGDVPATSPNKKGVSNFR